jgi:hypothetical protein
MSKTNKMAKKAGSLKVGDVISVRFERETITYVGPYGTSFHSVTVITDRQSETGGQAYAIDKMASVDVLN